MSWFSPPDRPQAATTSTSTTVTPRQLFINSHKQKIKVNPWHADYTPEQVEAEVDRRWNNPDLFPRQSFIEQAEKENRQSEKQTMQQQRQYMKQTAAYRQRVELPSFSVPHSLPQTETHDTATHLPPHGLSSAGVSDVSDRLLSLPTGGLYHILSFVPSFEFFLRIPRLSHSHQRVFSHPQLHQRYGRERFSLSDKQWQLFSASAWPALHVPIWKYAYYLSGGGFDERRVSKCLEQDAAAEGVQSSANKRQRVDPQRVKNWSCECFNLYQHILFASRQIVRHAPTVTSGGAKLQYRLPPTLTALIIDALTSQHLVLFDGKLNGLIEADCLHEAESMWNEFVPGDRDYEQFSARASPSSPAVLVKETNVQTVHTSTDIETATLTEWEEKLREEKVEADENEEPTDWELTDEIIQWLAEHAHGDDTLIASQPELLVLTSMNCGQWHGNIIDLLWIGPAVRRAIDAAAPSASLITVDLADCCPVVRFEPDLDKQAGPCRVVALSLDEWVAAGGMDGWYNRVSVANKEDKEDGDEDNEQSVIDDRRARQQRRAVWLDRALGADQQSDAAESEKTAEEDQSEAGAAVQEEGMSGAGHSKASTETEDEEAEPEAESGDESPPARLAPLQAAFRTFLRVTMLKSEHR